MQVNGFLMIEVIWKV